VPASHRKTVAPMIELEHVHRVFQVGDQEVHALNDIQLNIGRGEYLSIMGPSGSGKSTLLNLIGLLDTPTAGEYRFASQDIGQMNDDAQAALRREQIGFVFQFFHLVPRMTAAENIELPLVLAGMPPAQRKERVEAALAGVDLTERATHRPDQLSGGQRQRVAIARATIMSPSIILADEPTGNLDRASGHEVIELLEQLQASGLTLIVVTHDPELGARASRHLKMVDGRIISDNHAGTPA
jgi:putative ABC transport system ATP-binding protein